MTTEPQPPVLDPRRVLYILFGTWYRIAFSVWTLCFLVRAIATAKHEDDFFFEMLECKGTEFLYSTHGWTLVSAAVESVTGQPFPEVMREFFHEMGGMSEIEIF